MEDINLDEYNEMGTPINDIKNLKSEKIESSKKNMNINNFIKDLENNLDNFDSTEITDSPKASNMDRLFIDRISNHDDDNDYEDDSSSDSSENNENEEESINWNEKIYDLLIKIREPILIILLFIVFNNNELDLFINKIPFVNRLPNPYGSLIIRSIIFSLVITYLRKMENITTL